MILEALGFTGGAAAGGFLKLAGKLFDSLVANNTKERDFKKWNTEKNQSGWESARKWATQFSGGVWARRFIVLTVFSYLFVFPFVCALRGIPVQYGYLEEGAGFFGFGGLEKTKFQSMEGFAVMPFQTVIASTTAGFYFGASIVK